MTAQKVGDAAEDLEDKTMMDHEMTGGRRRRRSKSRRGSRKSRRGGRKSRRGGRKSRRGGRKSPRHSRKSRRHSRKSRMGGKRKACPKYCRRKTLRCKTYRRAHKKSHRRRRR
jgi:hypothetical protein